MRSEKRRRRRGLLALLLVLTLFIGILPTDRVQANGDSGTPEKTIDMEKTASDYSSYKFHEGETINVTKIGGSGASFSYYATKVDSDNYNYENRLYYESVETDETTESGSHKVKPYDSQLEE